MAKEPSRRYSTAAEMAEDLRRYLAGEPIRARQVSWGERLWLWAKKERALASALAAVVLLLLGSVVGSLVAVQQQARLASEKAAETKKAEEQRDLAIRNAYFADMKTAFDDWQNGHTRRMLGILKQYVPTASQKDLRNWEWYYLLSLAHQDEQTIHGHDGQVLQVRWAPDGNRFYSSSTDGSLRVWTADGQSIHRMEIPRLKAFALSPTGHQIATVCGNTAVWIWDTQTFTLEKEVQVDLPSVELVDWSPVGNRLAVSSGLNCKPVIFDTEIWQVITRTGAIRRGEILRFSPDGKFLAYGYLPIQVWDFTENRVAASIQNWNLRGMTLGWSPDSQKFAIGNIDVGCYLFELDQTRPVPQQFRKVRIFHENRIARSIEFHPDGELILVGDESNQVSIVSRETWETKQQFQGHLDFVSSVDWHPTEDRVISAGLDGTIKIWSWEGSAEPADAVNAHAEELPRKRGLSSDSKWSWEVSGKETIFRNAETDEVVARIPEPFPGKPFDEIHFYPKSKRVVLNNSWANVASWNTETWQVEKTWRYQQLSKGVQVANDKICIVRGSFDQPPWVVELIDIPTLESRTFLPHHQILKDNNQTYRGTDLATRLNSDASRLITASSGEVKIWSTPNVNELKELYTLVGHEPGTEMYNPIWSNTGRYAATLAADRTAKIWDVESGKLVTDIKGHQTTVYYLAFSNDDSRLLTVGNFAKLWDVATGREILTTNTVESTEVGKYSFEHQLSDFDTPLIRDFIVHRSKDDFQLPESALRFESLEKSLRLRRQADGIDEFHHAGIHDLALSLVARPKYDRHDPVRGLRPRKRGSRVDA